MGLIWKLFSLLGVSLALGKIVPDSYIVKYANDCSPNLNVEDYYPHIDAYSIKTDSNSMSSLLRTGDIEYVEPNQIFTHSAAFGSETQQNVPSWGLARISQEILETQDYTYPSVAGNAQSVYVLDTGILDSHPDFESRAKQLYTAPGIGENVDCNGHGTHVAGTIGGEVTGVAKKSTIIGVKVLSCNGSGTTASVLNGMEYILNQPGNLTKIINMSLGGGRSRSIDDLIANSPNALFIVAAGNSNTDACTGSPSGSPGALTVAASDIRDQKAPFSSYGACVDIVAPGVNITAPYIPEGFRSLSGTSMASPHVAGIAAIIQSQTPAGDAQTLKQNIIALGLRGKLGGFDFATPNLLSHLGTANKRASHPASRIACN